MAFSDDKIGIVSAIYVIYSNNSVEASMVRLYRFKETLAIWEDVFYHCQESVDVTKQNILY